MYRKWKRWAISCKSVLLALTIVPASAATYELEFYTSDQFVNDRVSIFGSPSVSTRILPGDIDPFAVGILEIEDDALGIALARIPLLSPSVKSFSVKIGDQTFSIPEDDLRNNILGDPVDQQLAVTLDKTGEVQRFTGDGTPTGDFIIDLAVPDLVPKPSLGIGDAFRDTRTDGFFVPFGGDLAYVRNPVLEPLGFVEEQGGGSFFLTNEGREAGFLHFHAWRGTRITGVNASGNVRGDFFIRRVDAPVPIGPPGALLASSLLVLAGYRYFSRRRGSIAALG